MSYNAALLTYGATATATQTWSGYDPSWAIDGNDGTGWMESDFDGRATLTIDLGEAREIASYRVLCYSNWFARFYLQYSTDNANWSTASSTYMWSYPAADQSEAFGSPITARYWRIVGNGAYTSAPWHILTLALTANGDPPTAGQPANLRRMTQPHSQHWTPRYGGR